MSAHGTGSQAEGWKFLNAAQSADYLGAMTGVDRNRITGQAKIFAVDLGRSEAPAARLLGAIIYVGTEVFLEDIEATFVEALDGNIHSAVVSATFVLFKPAKALKQLERVADDLNIAPKRPPIIIGENMDRVKAYADGVGGHAYRSWKIDPWDPATAMRRNGRWILDQRRAGREVIDIGPDFERRASTGYISDFYEMERRKLTGYDNYKKVFERSGSTGGVPGLDF